MTELKEQYRELVHTPADLANEGLAFAEHILTTPGVPFGVQCIDAKGAMNPMHPGDMVHTLADVTLAGKEIGYKPAYPFDRGLASFVDWFTTARKVRT